MALEMMPVMMHDELEQLWNPLIPRSSFELILMAHCLRCPKLLRATYSSGRETCKRGCLRVNTTNLSSSPNSKKLPSCDRHVKRVLLTPKGPSPQHALPFSLTPFLSHDAGTIHDRLEWQTFPCRPGKPISPNTQHNSPRTFRSHQTLMLIVHP